ncbi:hypothetical protein [Ramlibacter albus]|uniref:Uncharacterized protein n=1 Tax=Ramlibacter albus TaxID=2079448 RepID=A0A923M2X4_9BURK|nr:hypothetical protein [Ramlibacter albus]MBC5763167.1 hypothetical protein [Ramlibacter albus]
MTPTTATQQTPARLRAYGAAAAGSGGGRDHNAAIREAAQKRIKAGVFGAAAAAKAELDRLAAEIALETGSILLTAPVKSEERAAEKVKGDYRGDWLDLKDAARITLIARDEQNLKAVIGTIRKRMRAGTGHWLVKDQYVYEPHKECGYSGYNGVVRLGIPPKEVKARPLPEAFHPILMDELKTQVVLDGFAKGTKPPAYAGRFGEIQANSVAMMYGKMSKDSFIRMLGSAQYFLCRARFGVEGGAAHTLYEISRSVKSSPDDRRAAEELCRRYHRRLRNQDGMGADPRLNFEVLLFCKGVHAGSLATLRQRWRSGAPHADQRRAEAVLFMRQYARLHGMPKVGDFLLNPELLPLCVQPAAPASAPAA